MPVRHVGTRQRQKREIIAPVLVPADPHALEASHPTMRALHDPPAGLEAGLLRERLGLCPPRPDVGRAAELSQQLADLVVVIALVQAHPVRRRQGGRRALEREARARRLDHLDVIPLRPLDGEATGDAAAVGEDAPFGANLPALGRRLAHLFPPTRGFGQRPGHGQPLPITPCQRLVFDQTVGPQRQEDARRRPLLAAAMGGTTGTAASFLQRVPRTPGTQDDATGLHGLTISTAGPMAPQRV